MRPQLRSCRADRDTGRTTLTLHSKVAVVDSARVFVGSFNPDPRSLYVNTEMGIAIRSRGLARIMAGSIQERLPRFVYKLLLDSRGKLQWHYDTRHGPRTEVKEPHAGRW